MDCNELRNGIMQYEELYSEGMKRDANALLRNICQAIESTDGAEDILKSFVRDICDTDTLAFLFKRGNGEMPFQLKHVVREWLHSGCRQHFMPELRWFYQIFKTDPDEYESADAFLNEAYERLPSDVRTQELVFERNTDSLELGLHELPNGLLLSDEAADCIFRQCDGIMEYGNISPEQIGRYNEAKRTYSAYRTTETKRI